MESRAMTVFTARRSGIEEGSKTGRTMLYALYGELEIQLDSGRALLEQRADDFSATPDSLQTTCREERDYCEVREGISHYSGLIADWKIVRALYPDGRG